MKLVACCKGKKAIRHTAIRVLSLKSDGVVGLVVRRWKLYYQRI